MPNWRVWSRKLWTRRCSTPGPYRLAVNWTGYQLREIQIVSGNRDPIHKYHIYRLLTDLPIVKHPAKAQEEDDEEAELAKLRAEMAM